MKTVNTVIYTQDDYQEIAIMQSSVCDARIIECREASDVLMYRLEARYSNAHNHAFYTYDSAFQAFAQAIEEAYELKAAMRDATAKIASYVDRFHDAKLLLISAECALYKAQDAVEHARMRYSELENSNAHTASAKIC